MTPRRRLDPEQSRTIILDAAERLMREEGYASVSTRRVAAEAGVKAPLVHYYFPTTDDLLLAFYRRSTDQVRKRLEEALVSENPIKALWEVNADPQRTALAAEFLALANHRKSIREEIARRVEASRELQAQVFARLLGEGGANAGPCTPQAAALLLAGAARALVTEEGVGITTGHDDARAFVAWFIEGLEAKSKAREAQA